MRPENKAMPRLSIGALTEKRLIICGTEIALAEVMRDLVECTLLPLFGLSQPKGAARGIQRRTLSANGFLIAYLHEPVHAPHSIV
jgi:hypothetical protein